jgi:hypothetical protein
LEILLLELHVLLELFDEGVHFEVELLAEALEAIFELLHEEYAFFEVEFGEFAFPAADGAFVDEFYGFGLCFDGVGEPLDAVVERSDGDVVGVLCPPS